GYQPSGRSLRSAAAGAAPSGGRSRAELSPDVLEHGSSGWRRSSGGMSTDSGTVTWIRARRPPTVSIGMCGVRRKLFPVWNVGTWSAADEPGGGSVSAPGAGPRLVGSAPSSGLCPIGAVSPEPRVVAVSAPAAVLVSDLPAVGVWYSWVVAVSTGSVDGPPGLSIESIEGAPSPLSAVPVRLSAATSLGPSTSRASVVPSDCPSGEGVLLRRVLPSPVLPSSCVDRAP